jgi:internalin A
MAEINESSDGSAAIDPLQEAIRRIQEAEGTRATDLDLSNLGLGPLLRADWGGWETLGRLDSLRHLNLGENQITAIPVEGWEALGRLVGLSWLVLRKNQMTAIPAEGWQALGRLVDLGKLDLSENGMTPLSEAGWEALRRMARLERLYLNGNHIGDIPIEGWQVFGHLTNLSSLYLYGNMTVIPEEGWEALGRLADLESLAISQNKIGKISAKGWEALSSLPKLEGLYMSYNGIGNIPVEGWESLGRLANLKNLWLSGNSIAFVPVKGWRVLGSLAKIESLSLAANAISAIPEEGWEAVGRLANLEELWLGANELTTVPAKGWELLGRLSELRALGLAANRISDIPLKGWETRGRFAKIEEIDLSNNPLPEDILIAASRGPKSLFEYFEAARLRAAHPRTVKLMLLGEPASGKTTLVEALNGNPAPCDPNRPETIGVNLRRIEKKSPADGRPLYLATWDFAGQHMEYATHQFFLKAGGIYLILWKARLGSDYGQRDLWYWLELLKMRVRDPEFLLVTTHTSKTPAALDLHEVQASYPGCKGHFEVELSDGTGLAALEEKILELAVASPSMKAVWPAPWLAVRDAVRGMRERSPYIPAEAFWKLCAEHEVVDTRAQRDLADQLLLACQVVRFY